MKHLLLTTIAAVLLVGCAVEERSAESAPAKAKVESQATDAPAMTVEPPVAQAKEPPPTMTIHEAAAQGNIGIVRQHLAIQPGGYVNTRTPSDWTPLHFALKKRHAAVAKTLRPAAARRYLSV